MSEERDQLEQRLDEAFASLRPRAGYEAELLDRVRRQEASRPATPAAGHRGAWWTAAGAAAVVLAGFLGYLALQPHGGGSPSSAMSQGAAPRDAGPGAAVAGFGQLPRPPAGAQAVAGANASTPVVNSGQAAPGGTPGLVARYREPTPADIQAFAAALGASGAGARFSGPGLSLTFYPTQADLGLQAHYVLTTPVQPAGGTPPASGAAIASAESFLDQHRLPRTAAASVSVEGPIAVVSFARPPGNPVKVLVDGAGSVLEVDGPLPFDLEQATYPLAPVEQLRAAAGAGAGDSGAAATVLAFDGQYGYYEPAVAFVSAGGQQTLVPAVDPSRLR